MSEVSFHSPNPSQLKVCVELQSVTTFVLSCEARQKRVLDMLSKISISVSISGNDKSMVNISSTLVCF
jgi:hypothetical protein